MMKLKLRVPTRGLRNNNKDNNASSKNLMMPPPPDTPTEPESVLDTNATSQSPHSVASSSHQNSNDIDNMFDARFANQFEVDGHKIRHVQRSTSAQRRDAFERPMYDQQHYVDSSFFPENAYDRNGYEQPQSMKIVGALTEKPTDAIHIPSARQPSRSKPRYSSTERPRSSSVQPQRPISSNNLTNTNNNSISNKTAMATELDSRDSSDHDADKKRKSKMEKIRQLQAKNELYKEEYKRVQKDRKQLKRDLELKKDEILAMNEEIDAHINETSLLKDKLSKALQQLNQRNETDFTQMSQLTKELSQCKAELDAALQRVADVREEMEKLREQVIRKDEQITSLTEEVSYQSNVVAELQAENGKIKSIQRRDESDAERMRQLRDENETLHKELGSTLERAAAMVKEREDAISELLKENDEMKKLVSIRDKDVAAKADIDEDELNLLKEELNRTHAQLEDAQDRNVLLEDEIEAWMGRGTEMAHEIERLRDEIEEWNVKCEESDRRIAKLEKSSKDAKYDADKVREALSRAEENFNNRIAENEIKYRAALLEEREKTRQALDTAKAILHDSSDDRSAHSEKSRRDQQFADKQASFLEQAVANLQKKAVSDKGGWLAGFRKHTEEEEELDENQRRIKELESLNLEQEKEIQKLKSEIVRMRTTYNEQLYTSKKKIDRLEHENEAYALKARHLEEELANVTK